MRRLSRATLVDAHDVVVPDYDRSTTPAIVHLGIGAFARAHLAVYADDLLQSGCPAAIRGISLRSARAERELGPQDGWYTVTTREPAAPVTTRLVGSVASVASGTEAAIAAIADPATSLVTLTVTEKGYELEGLTSTPAVLAAALDRRRRRTGSPVVVAALDNLLDNGEVLRRQVMRAAESLDDELAAWTSRHVCFPRSVVDRMVPSTTEKDREQIAAGLGLIDLGAVVAEAHRSWVLEAVDGIPPLQHVGVELVTDVGPYERRKLWLLNGPHSAFAYGGLLAGHRTIAGAAADPVVSDFVRALVDDVLTVFPGDDMAPTAFAESSLRRFANPALGHTCAQVGADGSRKLPQRLLPVMDLRQERGLATDRFAVVVATWLAAVTATPVTSRLLPPIDDPATDDIRVALRKQGAEAAVAVAFGDRFRHHGPEVAQTFARVAREGVGALGVRQ